MSLAREGRPPNKDFVTVRCVESLFLSVCLAVCLPVCLSGDLAALSAHLAALNSCSVWLPSFAIALRGGPGADVFQSVVG